MCRNIKPLFNFDPPVTPEEVRAASLQFVRKITGFNKPSKANEASFVAAIDEIARISAEKPGSRSRKGEGPGRSTICNLRSEKFKEYSRSGLAEEAAKLANDTGW